MITDLEEALSFSRSLKRKFGAVREVYVSESVLRKMIEEGAEGRGLNKPRLVDSKVDGRIYAHSVTYRRGVFTCFSENQIE